MELVNRAKEFAHEKHKNHFRASGDPYFEHLQAVADIVMEWGLDETSIAAAYLHDCVEDVGVTLDEIEAEFGSEVRNLVDGLTKVSHVRLLGSREEVFTENLRKLFLATAKDIRVVLVKLADRLHNMRTIKYLPEEKQKKISEETLQIFAPLAERLGMGEVKGELEDLAFPILYPEEYTRVVSESKKYYNQAEKIIRQMRRQILFQFSKNHIKAQIDARKKHYYSLWRKLERPGVNWNWSMLHDIIAFRIIVPSVKDCYLTLGVLHTIYANDPLYGVGDFISHPKTNGYQSLHTKIIGPNFSVKFEAIKPITPS